MIQYLSWTLRAAASFAFLFGVVGLASANAQSQPYDPDRGLLLRGTLVTMDDRHSVVGNGGVLVRQDRIVAVWQSDEPPRGTPVNDAVVVDFGPTALIFPGMINLHNHPTYDTVRLWPAPSSDVQPTLGRPLGTEPYANRYQWNGVLGTSPEHRRLVDSPQLALALAQALGLEIELVKYAQVLALVGGETTNEGALPNPATDTVLARNVESPNFGRQRIQSFVPSIDSLTGPDLDSLLAQMKSSQVDAWIVHLAEGVRDADRRPGDAFSSRGEFQTLKSKGLLTDMTVIIHGIALERPDFVEMSRAPSIRSAGAGDGLGAKLVWSPLSNLLLYGRTANVYEAMAEGVTVALGTDWNPSGSRNLIGELKIADIALRDPSLLGGSRSLIPEFSTAGKHGEDQRAAEIALDRRIVDMVTRNPAAAVHWQNDVGSLEAGKTADLFIITPPDRSSQRQMPSSPYRTLIDATERDVRLVLVSGNPLVGDADIMQQLKPGASEIIQSDCACFQKAVAIPRSSVAKGNETLADIQQLLNDGFVALGGDHPPPGGGPASLDNTYSYLNRSNTNQLQGALDPFGPAAYEDRWYPLSGDGSSLLDPAGNGNGGACHAAMFFCRREQ